MALGLQLGAADAHVVPGVRLHPDLVPHALAIQGGEVDVEIGEGRPGLVVLVVADLAADRADLAVLLLGRLDEARHVEQEFAVEMRPAGAIPSEQIVTRSGRGFGGGARGDVCDGNVIDRDRDLVLRPSPWRNCRTTCRIPGRSGSIARSTATWCRPAPATRMARKSGRGGRKAEARFLQELSSRDTRNSACTHLRLLLCLSLSVFSVE